MPNLLQIISGTPFWVWIVFAYILFVGINALRKRIVPVYRFAIMPIIFVVWSIVSLYDKTTFSLIMWSLFYGIGITLGYYMMRRLNISINKETYLVHIPGSVIPLIISCSFFLVKYCLGVSYALNPILKFNVIIAGFDGVLSGIFSGISTGRFLKILHKYYTTLFHKKF